MWRNQTFRRGKQILTVAQRQLAAEAGGAAPTPTPPQPKPRAGYGIFKVVGLGVPLATSGVLGYALYDQDFRHQLEENVPYAKDLLDNVLPGPVISSNPPASSAAPEPLFGSSSEVAKPHTVSGVFPGSLIASAYCLSETDDLHEKVENGSKNKGKGKSDTRKRSDSNLTQDDIQNCSYPVPQAQFQLEVQVSDAVQEVKQAEMTMEEKLKKKQLEEKADNAALEVVIEKLLESGQNWVSEAARAQMDVVKSTNNHSTYLKRAMDETNNILNKDAEWEAVTVAYKERENAINRANELVDEARKSIVKLKLVLDEAKANKVTMKNQSIYAATKKLSEFGKEMSAAGAQVRQADADAKVILKYKDLVDKGKKQFQLELDSLLPDAKRGRSGKLNEEELNALIAHAHRRIEQLQKQIAEQMALEQRRLSAALEMQKREDKGLTDSAVSDERARLMSEFELERQKMEIEFVAWMEADVRKQLSRQSAAHSDHLKDVLTVQEHQLNREFERKMNIKLLEEREKFQSETVSWLSRLKGIEAAVDARAASEKLAHTAQELWLACIALNSTIQFGDDSSNLVALDQHVNTVLHSCDKHPFVETIAKTIPETALERGVYTESALRDRFVKVSQVSRRLGLVEDSNASLYKYLVSFIHSFFTINRVAAYSEKDLISIDEMDNFKIVANAQYWMERGNLELAVRFMCQLTGESRTAASDWIEEAKLLLETRQAAQTILSFASATGLAATF